MIPLLAALLVGGAAVAYKTFWEYENDIISLPDPLTATVIGDLGNQICPRQTLTLEVLITNEGSEIYTVRLLETSTFVSGVAWDNVTINGAIPDPTPVPYAWGDPLEMDPGMQHTLVATIVAGENIGAGTSTVRLCGVLE